MSALVGSVGRGGDRAGRRRRISASA